jgi:hypothetical protein
MHMLVLLRNMTDQKADFWNCHNILNTLAIDTSNPYIASSGHETIRVSCADEIFDIARSRELTSGKLQDAVSLLLRCHPDELIFTASDIDLESGTDTLGRGLAACLAYATHIHFSIRCREDMEMAEAPSRGAYQ